MPASPDAFVWLRLYQPEMDRPAAPRRRAAVVVDARGGRSGQLAYHAVHRMFEPGGRGGRPDATLHALRHTAAYRMAEDPDLPLTDVILSFRVIQGCDLQRPVVDSVADETLAA